MLKDKTKEINYIRLVIGLTLLIVLTIFTELFVKYKATKEIGRDIRPLAIQITKISNDVLYLKEVKDNCKDEKFCISVNSDLIMLYTDINNHHTNVYNKMKSFDIIMNTDKFKEYKSSINEISIKSTNTVEFIKGINPKLINVIRDIEKENKRIIYLNDKFNELETVGFIDFIRNKEYYMNIAQFGKGI